MSTCSVTARRLLRKRGPYGLNNDLAQAIELLKSPPTEEERQTTVYLDGLTHMPSDWPRREKRRTKGEGGTRSAKTPK